MLQLSARVQMESYHETQEKQKVRQLKPKLNAGLQCYCNANFTNTHRLYVQLRIPRMWIVKHWKMEIQLWGKCWHMGLFFGNDLSHKVTSPAICLSFMHKVSTLVVQKMLNWLTATSRQLRPTVSTPQTWNGELNSRNALEEPSKCDGLIYIL